MNTDTIGSGTVRAKSDSEVSVTLWGTGKPMREFLHSDDLADACIFLMNKIDFKDLILNHTQIRNTHINIGTGNDLTIQSLAATIQEIIGFSGQIIWDEAKPDGTLRKLQDVSKINDLGWKAQIPLKDGLKKVYKQYN